jgi:hypothetical protein
MLQMFNGPEWESLGVTVRKASLAAMAFSLEIVLAGCAIMPVKHRLPIPKAPAVVQSVTPQDLVTKLNRRWDALHTLYLKVEIQATLRKSKEGVAETLPESDGWILLSKPEMLRVAGNYLGIRTFDMVGDGRTFTLEIPLKSRAIEGSYTSTEKSADSLYNLRPGFFYDAIFVEGLKPEDHYSVITNTETIEDAAKKHLLSVPEYILNIARLKPGSPEMIESRVITFHREDLLPYKQDIYDDDGNLQSEIHYRNYRPFQELNYPSVITIDCPPADIEIVLTVVQVKENIALPENAFELRLPPDTKVEHLK